jgi:hypothetical protein
LYASAQNNLSRDCCALAGAQKKDQDILGESASCYEGEKSAKI